MGSELAGEHRHDDESDIAFEEEIEDVEGGSVEVEEVDTSAHAATGASKGTGARPGANGKPGGKGGKRHHHHHHHHHHGGGPGGPGGKAGPGGPGGPGGKGATGGNDAHAADTGGGGPGPGKGGGDTGGAVDQGHAADHGSSSGGGLQTQSLGMFKITHYIYALENDPMFIGPSVMAPGLPKPYKQKFLYGNGVMMQGTGLANDGKYIHYTGSGFAYGVGGATGKPQAWKTIATDPSVIKQGSQVEIDIYKDKGEFTANDTGGAINGHHVDVFVGPMHLQQAYALGTKFSTVRLVTGGHVDPSGGNKDPGGQTGPGGQNAPGGGGAVGPGKWRPAPPLGDVASGKADLTLHMKGPAVAEVQKLLGGIAVDGDFGPLTLAAVKQFQQQHHDAQHGGLVVDGVVGPKTLAVLEKKGSSPDKPATGGGDKGDVPAASGGDPVAIARQYVKNPPIPSINLRGKMPHFEAAGGVTNDCADFVSSVLQIAGRLGGHEVNVDRLYGLLVREGWHRVPKSKAQPGDVWFNPGHHVELVTGAGGSELIGSNGSSYQHVTVGYPYVEGVYMHKDFGGGGTDKQAPQHEGPAKGPGAGGHDPHDPKQTKQEAPSHDAARQMSDLIATAKTHMPGGTGWCYRAVSNFLAETPSGYGKILHHFPPEIPPDAAHDFADYMNGHASKYGLKRLAIDSPYDAPAGAIVVVKAGSPGTWNLTAGDISVAIGGGRFINDHYQSYGPPADFTKPYYSPRFGHTRGILLGAYEPL